MLVVIGHPLLHFLADSASIIMTALRCGNLFLFFFEVYPKDLFAQCLQKDHDLVCFRFEQNHLKKNQRRDGATPCDGCGRIQAAIKYDSKTVKRSVALIRQEIYCVQCLGKQHARVDAETFFSVACARNIFQTSTSWITYCRAGKKGRQ